ncbi:photosynthetic complex assembly protein PuhC [Methylobacterium organophilum]|uniref:Photosynthetic complex assembly protein n=1 Tax=Methylobacterium organophilum TaxID=410 RepID=A0ABQ4TEL8_METOR|nr:photosynthetic complex assembly protein PuhC [Methylobacterium organophilum]UMY15832.1 putative photosynthetic complex assembly protein PuhC [Methylobacterium organophilum]GJE28555.1 hypothetical protein LKMONMHP_3427 [Methylobacterium organophilum]
MPDRTHTGPIPKLAALGILGLLGFTMVAAGFGRREDIGRTVLPEATPLARLDFRAEDAADGSIALKDAATARLLATIRPGEDGFVRGTLRSLAQARQREGLGRATPFRLTRYDDGRLSLADAATGRSIALEAFGPDNARAFARLLPDSTETR